MATLQMAPITINEGNNELRRIEPNEMYRMLYVEDEPEVRAGIVARFHTEGFKKIDVASTPSEAAELIEPDKYQLLVMDIRFHSPHISGDEFIYKNQDILAGTPSVAFTGHAGDIQHDVFDDVILKGNNQRLINFAKRQREQWKNELRENLITTTDNLLSGHPIAISKYPLTEEKMKRLENQLLAELEKVANKQKILVRYKGERYSTEQLIEEIKKGSEVGNAHIEMMFDLMEENT